MIDKNNVAVILIIILAIVFFGFLSFDRSASLKKKTPSDNSQTDTTTKQNVNTSSVEETQSITIDPRDLQEGVKVESGVIYFYGKEKGYIDSKGVNIRLGDGYISFAGNPGEIAPPSFEGATSFYYNDLEISTYIACPYKICHSKDTISYKCSGPLVQSNENLEEKWEYCETNRSNYLSQYEFSAANGNGFATGGEISYGWYKLYMKKFNSINLFLFGNLGEPLNRDETDQAKINHLSGKGYLDELLQEKKNQEKIAQWDAFAKSVQFSFAKTTDAKK
ncbi:MAG: hypothetical protein PHX30_00330 [Candidatus Pacebacteria bacterium]|nr:hypothetical protein [Candidatus Paceibacterota bacterium]